MASDLASNILQYIADHDSVESFQLAAHFGEDHQKIVGAIKSLQSLGEVVNVEQRNSQLWLLTDEGKQIVDKGSHESILFKAIPADGILQAEAMKSVPNAKIGFSKAMSAGWIGIDKSSGAPKLVRKVTSIKDQVREDLCCIQSQNIDLVSNSARVEYKKRKLLQEATAKTFTVRRGKDFSLSVTRLETDLTAEMLASGSWKTQQFKPYNFAALGAALPCGYLHPLMKVRAEFRQIFLEMGFTEMPTNNYIESSFWNFDSLFQPQQHPARDAHDTFFLSEPSTANIGPNDYVQRVKKVHSEGDYGSQGYGYNWSTEEARKNVLRTHTTAVSARMLYKLAQGPFHPVKYFSIDRVFRNETLDATHLAEFCQIEGVIADYGLTLGDLIGTLYEFFAKLGITKLQFKPAYNPYTEPSMEIFSYHEGLGKWVEVGNSGMFRPEMLQPMGLPSSVTVIAWGLSLERPTMIKYGIDNIRDLVGPRVNLEMVYSNPICRLDKYKEKKENILDNLEKHWETIHQRLAGIEQGINRMKNTFGVSESMEEVVVFADPAHPPYSIPILATFLGISAICHLHSTVKDVAEKLQHFFPRSQASPVELRLIWKTVGVNPQLVVSALSSTSISGEANIARYLARVKPVSLFYKEGSVNAEEVDIWLDHCHTKIVNGDGRERQLFVRKLISTLNQSSYLLGSDPSLADIVVWSFLKQYRLVEDTVPNVNKWAKSIEMLRQ